MFIRLLSTAVFAASINCLAIAAIASLTQGTIRPSSNFGPCAWVQEDGVWVCPAPFGDCSNSNEVCDRWPDENGIVHCACRSTL